MAFVAGAQVFGVTALELVLDIRRQVPALHRHMGDESRIVLLDNE